MRFFVVGPPGPLLFYILLIISDYKNHFVKMTIKITAKCLAVKLVTKFLLNDRYVFIRK